MPTKTTKTGFDAIAFKHKVQAEIYEEIKEMTPEQKIEYFRRAAETGPMADLWKRIKRNGHRSR